MKKTQRLLLKNETHYIITTLIKLNDTFIREFRKNNKEQIKKYNKLMNK